MLKILLLAVSQCACLLVAVGWFAGHMRGQVEQVMQQQVLADIEQAAGQMAEFMEHMKEPEAPDWMTAMATPQRQGFGRWEPVQRMVERVKLGNGRFLCVVDATKGDLICHSQLRYNLALRALKPGLAVMLDREGEQRIIDAFPRALSSGQANPRLPGPSPIIRGRAQMPDGIYWFAARQVPRFSVLVLSLQREAVMTEASGQLASVIWKWGVAGTALLVLLTGGLAFTISRRLENRLDATHDNLDRVVQFRMAELTKTNNELRTQILENKRIDAAVKEREERINLVVQSVQDYAIIMLDPDGCVASWNAGARLITGYLGEEITGQSMSRFYTVEDRLRNKPEQHLQRAGLGRCETEGWRLRKNGTRFWASVLITPVQDMTGERLGFAAVMRDITAAKKTKESVRVRDLTLESLAEGLIIIGARQPGHPILYCNPAWERITGFARAEILGQPLAQLLGPNEIDPAMIELRQAIEDKRPVTVEGPARRKDGTIFWSLTSVSVIKSSRGRPRYLAILQRDLTAQKNQEVQLRAEQRTAKRSAENSRSHRLQSSP